MNSNNNTGKFSLLSTWAGFASIILWSTAVAFSRSIMEKLGVLNGGFYILMFSALFNFLIISIKYRKNLGHKINKLPIWYYWKVGVFWIIYEVLFLLSIGLVKDHREVVVVGIINYLWVGLIFLFSALLLRTRVNKIVLITGLIIATLGTGLAIFKGNGLNTSEIPAMLHGNFLAYLLVLIAAISWGLYSNLTKKFKTENDDVALPFLFLLSGISILIIQLFNHELPIVDFAKIKVPDVFEFAYVVIFPSVLAYTFWDMAMKKGNKNLVNLFAYSIPLTSTLISSFYLNIKIDIYFGLAAILVTIGAWLCKKSVVELNKAA